MDIFLRKTGELLDLASIPRVKISCKTVECAVSCANGLGYPLVMKVVGPIHKSDVE